MNAWSLGLALALASSLAPVPATAAQTWPQFRGPTGEGHVESSRLPVQWSESENVTWQTPIPGTGWSSPVLWGDTVWMATATEEGQSLRGVCVDRRNGRVLHEQEIFRIAAPEPIHKVNSHASPTPIVDERHVYFFFGMYGAACLDRNTGKQVWKNTDLPHDHGKNGPGSSPILHGDLLILTCDGTEKRYVTALDRRTGKRVWTTERSNGAQLDGKPGDLKKAYHTPLVITVDGHEELISVGAFRVSGLDPKTGRELWWIDIPGFSNVPRPVYGHGLLFIATGFMKPEMWAVRPGGHGDVTGTHVAWKVARQAPQKPSPLLVGDELYMVADNGILTCIDARTGAIHYSERLGGEFSASPIESGGRIYLFDQSGVGVLVAAGKEFKVIGRNQLGDGCMASPAAADNSLFIRSKSKLYRIESRPPASGS